MAELKDSGERRDFETGAVRDAGEGKGRCDLLTLTVISNFYPGTHTQNIFRFLDEYVRSGNTSSLFATIAEFSWSAYDGNWSTMFLDVSHQYEDGARKYSERNWEHGIPLHCYIDSGVRHYLKYLRGDKDEPHDRAFVWNMLCAIWTHNNKPEMIDLPFALKEKHK